MRLNKLLLVAGVLAIVGPSSSYAQGGIRWVDDPYQARQIAVAEQRLLLLHFYTVWCGPCQRLEREVFPQYDVIRAMSGSYVPAKVDAEKYKDLANFYRIKQYPTDVIIDPSGKEVYRNVTPPEAGRYARILDDVAADFRQATAPGYGAMARGGTEPQRGWEQDPRAGRGPMAPDAQAPVMPSYQENRFASPGDRQAGYPNAYLANQPVARPAPYDPAYGSPYAAPAGPGGANPYAPAERSGRGGAYQTNPYAPATGPSAPGGGWQPLAAQPSWSGAANYGGTGTVSDRDPPLALDGYCPVTLGDRDAWERGDPRWGAMHRGRTYLFATAENQRKFLADPDRYSPMLSGYDVVRYIDRGELVPGKRRHGMWYQGKMYLFNDESTLDHFSRSPDVAQQYARRTLDVMMASTGR